jgi:uridine phosphorylase
MGALVTPGDHAPMLTRPGAARVPGAVPAYLRPTAPIAADAVLVGDPGRALLLAQELLEEPKMSNHARGLWGYWGQTPAGNALTIQATGIGGPSAALVLHDLAELGARRVVRVGTCFGSGDHSLGELVLVSAAIAAGGSAASLGIAVGETVTPDANLTGRVSDALGEGGQSAAIASVDARPDERALPAGAGAADMQTAPLLARARSLGIVAAAILIVAERSGGEGLEKEALELAEKRAGRAASTALSA